MIVVDVLSTRLVRETRAHIDSSVNAKRDSKSVMEHALLCRAISIRTVITMPTVSIHSKQENTNASVELV